MGGNLKAMMRNYRPMIIGMLIIWIMILLFDGSMIDLSSYFSFATPGKMFLRDAIYFVVFFILGAALALISSSGSNYGFRLKKTPFIIGIILLSYYFIALTLYYFDFVSETIDINYYKLDVFQLLIAKTPGYYAAYPRIFATTLCGFLVVHGIYGIKDNLEHPS